MPSYPSLYGDQTFGGAAVDIFIGLYPDEDVRAFGNWSETVRRAP